MLTPKQIEAARFWAHSLADPEVDRDLLARGVIDGALAAYERVVSLLERWDAEHTMLRSARDELRRALDGE